MGTSSTFTLKEPRRLRTRGTAGFSLVEVALAIGITVFATVAIVGVMPVGLDTFLQTKNVTVASEISRQIFSQVQIITFAQLTGGSTTALRLASPKSGGLVRYYDEQGTELASTGGVAPANAIYQANVRVLPSTAFVQPSSAGTNPDLATVTIQVAYNPGNLTLTFDSSTSTLWIGPSNVRIFNYQSLVAKNL